MVHCGALEYLDQFFPQSSLSIFLPEFFESALKTLYSSKQWFRSGKQAESKKQPGFLV